MIEDTQKAYLHGGLRKISPFFVPGSIINMVAGLVSIHYGYKGPNLGTVSACSTGNHSLGEAARLIEYGDADIMIAGGAEATVSPLGVGGFCAARALSHRNDDPATASRPWDVGRDGFVLGEGAGILVLEEYEHAKARGARIYCELAGYGMSADAHHITAPPEDGDGARSMVTRYAMRISSRTTSITSTRTARRRNWRSRRVYRRQAHVRRSCSQARGVVDQVDDRPPAGRRRGHRGGVHRARDPRSGRAADSEPRRAGSAMQPRLRAA
jgi:3-oxoacyl-(acyl-carrier-protein) synthase